MCPMFLHHALEEITPGAANLGHQGLVLFRTWKISPTLPSFSYKPSNLLARASKHCILTNLRALSNKRLVIQIFCRAWSNRELKLAASTSPGWISCYMPYFTSSHVICLISHHLELLLPYILCSKIQKVWCPIIVFRCIFYIICSIWVCGVDHWAKNCGAGDFLKEENSPYLNI
jgi:hypothetical protein